MVRSIETGIVAVFDVLRTKVELLMKSGKIREMVLGKALEPLKSETRHSLALVAFLARVGLGAGGLSSSAYSPEETFRALGTHTHLGLYRAIATAVTVFIIAIAYNLVIELFPTGGGGYRVPPNWWHPTWD